MEGPVLNPGRVVHPPQLQGATLADTCVGATHASPLLNDAPLDTCRDTACRALWILALVPPPPYTLPITILSTSSLTRSVYLIVRDPGHYSRYTAVAWVSRHEREVDGSSGGGGRRCIKPWGRLPAGQRGQHLPAMAMMPARGLEARATGSACSLPDAA
ncbi:MAG: hypothetical protein KatS3mg056_2306 [Chloroflexus sp.]|jgi:hypothetical protein|nr:MAG: hypothetical protein KatS3mg056_2306 [Chloroflexus sp.]